MANFILLIYISTYSMSGGMTVTSAPFFDLKSCEAAASAARGRFGSMASSVKTLCVEGQTK